MTEREYPSIELKHQVRLRKLMTDLFIKVFNERQFTIEAPHANRVILQVDPNLSNSMRRVLVMDLLYLKEFKQDVFRSDFDEFTFTMYMLLDITRCLAERDEGLKQLHSDRVKMNRAFGGSLRSKIGIIVPFERSVHAFN